MVSDEREARVIVELEVVGWGGVALPDDALEWIARGAAAAAIAMQANAAPVAKSVAVKAIRRAEA